MSLELKDLIFFTLVFLGWYVFLSLLHYVAYFLRRVLLLKGAQRQYEETHGMMSIEEDKTPD